MKRPPADFITDRARKVSAAGVGATAPATRRPTVPDANPDAPNAQCPTCGCPTECAEGRLAEAVDLLRRTIARVESNRDFPYDDDDLAMMYAYQAFLAVFDNPVTPEAEDQ